MTSPSATSVAPTLEVLKLQPNPVGNKGHMALLVKLTEDCLTALNNANRNRMPIKMKMEAQGGFIEIGSGEHAGRFRFAIQQIPGTPGCCIVSDRLNNYRLNASFQSKIQVQATNRSFAETREKAQKIEEEKRKALKDVSQKHDRRRPVIVKRATNQVAIGAQRPSPSSSVQQKPHVSEFTKNEKVSNGVSNGSSVTGLAGAQSIVRAEISRKPLRKRVIHLILFGKYSNFEDVLTQLRKGSVNMNDDTSETLKAKDILEEVTEVNRNTGRLQLKQAFYNEVDPRWPGFTSEEKSTVRKILKGNVGSSIFAPTRRNGIAPPTAPSASHATNNAAEANGIANVSSPSLPSKEKYSSNNSSRKSSPKDPSPNVFSSAKKISPKASPPENVNSSKKSSPVGYTNNTSVVSDETSPTPAPTAKRKAHGPSPLETAQKRVHFSIPDCCDQAKGSEQNVVDKTSVNLHSSASLTGSFEPSRDWSREFGEARSHSEALRYYDLFNADYPRYMKYFNYVNSVANEFIDLQKQLNEKPKHHDHQEIVRILHNKILQYKADVEYLRARKMHNDLRAKLDVLKKRIISWEAGCAENEASEPELESHAATDGNLMVK